MQAVAPLRGICSARCAPGGRSARPRRRRGPPDRGHGQHLRAPPRPPRAVPGSLGGDLIIGTPRRRSTLVERASRFCLLLHLPGTHAPAAPDALVAAIRQLPRPCASLTWTGIGWPPRPLAPPPDLRHLLLRPPLPLAARSTEHHGLLRQYFPAPPVRLRPLYLARRPQLHPPRAPRPPSLALRGCSPLSRPGRSGRTCALDGSEKHGRPIFWFPLTDSSNWCVMTPPR